MFESDKIECSQCYGEGTLHFSNGMKDICRQCMGTGEVPLGAAEGRHRMGLSSLEKIFGEEKNVVRPKIDIYRHALETIANNEFQRYDRNSPDSYGKGVADGHRYCAVIAKQALHPIEEHPANG